MPLPKRRSVRTIALVVLLTGTLAGPAGAHSASKNASWGPHQGCSWSGSQGYAGYPNLIATGATTSNCGAVQFKMRYLDGTVWRTHSWLDTDGAIGGVISPADHIAWTDHNVRFNSTQWVGARINH